MRAEGSQVQEDRDGVREGGGDLNHLSMLWQEFFVSEAFLMWGVETQLKTGRRKMNF